MSSFQFSDEEKPQPPASAPPPKDAPAATPRADEEEDDFSFLSQPPAATPAQPATPQPATPQPARPQAKQPQPAAPQQAPAPGAGAARPKAGAAQAKVPGGAARPQSGAPQGNAPQANASQGASGQARPQRAAGPQQPRPLQAGTGARVAPRVPDPAEGRAIGARPTKATFDPNAPVNQPSSLHPVGVPSPAAAPNSAAAAALTPVEGEATAEDLTGMETGDKLAAGFFGLGTSIRRALDMIEGPASWALRVFGVVGLLCLAFLLAALFFSGIGNLEPGTPKAIAAIRNLGYAAKGFSICLLISAIASLLLSYEDNKIGAIFAFIGGALWFGSPLLVKMAAGESQAAALVGAAVIPPLSMAGRALLYIGAAKATIDVFDFLWKLPDRVKAKNANVGQGRPTEAKQRAIASQANMMSPCWKLPFCRESIRVLCPAFIAKKTCWKFGRGCYCDEEMIARIVRGEPMAVISAPTRISQSKPPCGRCYIYLEHQTYKFRMLSPLALPATILIGYLGYPLYEQAFGLFDKALQSVWGMFSFTPPVPKAIDTTQANKDLVENVALNAGQVSDIAQAIIGVLLGFFLLIYISKGIEWAIFKAKL